MATPSLSSAEFVVGFCTQCAAEVLTHLGIDEADNIRHLCLHCDARVETLLRSIASEDLEAQGYAVLEARGCGNGGGCGSGGCGLRPR